MRSFAKSQTVNDVMSQVSHSSSREGMRFFILGQKEKPKHAFVWTSEVLHQFMAEAIDNEKDRRNFPDIKLTPLIKSINDSANGWWSLTGAYQPAASLITDASINPSQLQSSIDFQKIFQLDDDAFENMLE